MKAEIQSITAAETWPIRQRVFWPDQPISQGMLEDDPMGQHFGVFVEGKLVAIASLFTDGDTIRLRKMATVEDYQNLGLGSRLLEYVIGHARESGAKTLWCNVHQKALAFFENSGFVIESDTRFHKGAEAYYRIARPL